VSAASNRGIKLRHRIPWLRWKFRYRALRNWLDGYAFSSIKRCRSCDHTTPYHYPKCIRGVSRIEFEQGTK